jgi:hypothetical protein
VTIRFGDDRAFQALLATVDRAWPGDFAAAGRLGDVPVHDQMVKVKPEQMLVGGKHQGRTGGQHLVTEEVASLESQEVV